MKIKNYKWYIILMWTFLPLIMVSAANPIVVVNNIQYEIDKNKTTAQCIGLNQNIETVPVIQDYVEYENNVYPVTSIKNKAFNANNYLIGELKIGENITNIGYNSFENCKNIEGKLIIPNSVVRIEKNAFTGCSNISILVIGKSVQNIGYDSSYNASYEMENLHPGYTFANCSGLKAIICLPADAPMTYNVGSNNNLDVNNRPTGPNRNFSNYDVNFYRLSNFTGTGECYATNGWSQDRFKSIGEWTEFKNTFDLEDSEYAGFIDGTYGDDNGNGDTGTDNPGANFDDSQYRKMYLNQGESKDLNDFLGLVDLRRLANNKRETSLSNLGLGNGLPESSREDDEDDIYSIRWKSSDENIALVSSLGVCTANAFGTVLITAYEENGEELGGVLVYVSPEINIEYSDGRIYKHHVVYNSFPTLYFKIPEGFEIVSIKQNGEDVTETINTNEGYYTPASPITDNTFISVDLNCTKDPADLNGDGVVNVVDMNILIERMMNY